MIASCVVFSPLSLPLDNEFYNNCKHGIFVCITIMLFFVASFGKKYVIIAYIHVHAYTVCHNNTNICALLRIFGAKQKYMFFCTFFYMGCTHSYTMLNNTGTNKKVMHIIHTVFSPDLICIIVTVT